MGLVLFPDIEIVKQKENEKRKEGNSLQRG